ncbi:Uu.00g112610.m01.CDS01 [Anthostomella pinea]|uniref:Uu.00g112610.m01.CDS01 n=1 Tax=Anthostomella pinea TaxID=933095 RepID=A0AAI8VFD6_9PEZI|nr:Uu.00g112610.m01.CDS01 [Anthostomella pinea]
MQISSLFLGLLGLALGTAILPQRRTTETITYTLPDGHGVNGTMVIDKSKAKDYFKSATASTSTKDSGVVGSLTTHSAHSNTGSVDVADDVPQCSQDCSKWCSGTIILGPIYWI